MRVSYSMFVGQYNPPANEGYDKLRGQVFVVARKPHEPNTHPYEPNELLVQPIGADSMRRALKEPRISYTGLKERHFRVLAELTKGTNANQVDLNAYKEQLDIEASYDAPVDTTEDQLKEAEYDVLYEYDERGEVDLPELISRVRSGELPEGPYYSETSLSEIEFKDNKIHFIDANLDDRFSVPVRKVVDDVDVAIVKTSYMQFQSYEVSKRLALFDVFVKYANTPLGERHTEDEFVFEYTGSKTRKQYFTYDIHTQMVGFRVDPWNWITRCRFTDSNIANMTKEAQAIMLTLTKRPYSNKIQREAEGEIHA